MNRRPRWARECAGCGIALFLLALGGIPAPRAAAEDTAPRAAAEDTAPPAALSLEPAERTRLIEAYNRWAAGIHTLRAGGKARVGAEGEKTRAFQFSLLVARPGNARVQGLLGSLATLFDLSGSSEEWTLYLPQEREVVRAGTARAAPVLFPARFSPCSFPPEFRLAIWTGREPRAWIGAGLMVVPPGSGARGAFHRVICSIGRHSSPPRSAT
jgi:hypothetical protein